MIKPSWPGALRIPFLFLLCAVVIGAALIIHSTANADLNVLPLAQKPDNSPCLACHDREEQTKTLPSGEVMSVTVSGASFEQSVHANVSCQVCHTNISGYPHPENTAQSLRDYLYQYQDTCKQCHPAINEAIQDSVHTRVSNEGNKQAPICADCHNPHQQKPIQKEANGSPAGSEHAVIAQTCARCHSAIYEKYAQSVHGQGVLQNHNPDVPACTSCHGVHSIADPTTAKFRLSSIQMCANCHTDSARMQKYGLSTQVLDTYVADFHGTTVTLFQQQHPDEQVNMPVCYDCHGVHDIARTDDPQKGIQVKENLLITCQKCHPDATTNFPNAWLSHYIPSKDRYPLVYYVQLFYKIFIPTVIGSMLVFVLSDVARRLIERNKQRSAPKEG